MELQKRIEDQNVHWRGEKMSALKYRRTIFGELWKDIKIKPMSLITGMRRLGKSVVMKQMVDKLIEDGVNPKQILFFELWPGEKEEVLEDVLRIFQKEVCNQQERRYIFLDEIQYVKNYEVVLKDWYDRFEDIKFVLTGSFSLLYKKDARDSLAGRYLDYQIFPLSFREYREMKGEVWKDDEVLDKRMRQGLADSLNYDFRNFLINGRLPEIINYPTDRVANYIEAMKNQIMTQDVFNYFEIEKQSVLLSLFRYIVKNNGGMVSIDVLARSLGVTRVTVEQYIKILKLMGLIYMVYNSNDPLKIDNVAKKIYVSSFFSNDESLDNLGTLVESYVLERMLEEKKQVTFYRKRDKELDFLVVKEKKAYEVKFSHKIDEVNKYVKLADKLKYKLEFITLDQLNVGEIECMPACLR